MKLFQMFLGKEKNFINEGNNTLTLIYKDRESVIAVNNYDKAMQLKKEGKNREAVEILIKSTNPPSIYKGHYRELFKIWRQMNKTDIEQKNYGEVILRVNCMIKLDDEMIEEMLRYWSVIQDRKLPKNYFDSDRNLKLTDAKNLLKAAINMGNKSQENQANILLEKFNLNKD